jgi:hypothetical protein
MKWKRNLAAFAVLLLVALVTPSAMRADTIGFTGGNGSTGTGTASFNGNTFTVAGAEIDQVSIDGTSYAVSDGVLNLTSGTEATIISGCTGGACIATLDPTGSSVSITGMTLGLSSVSTLLSGSYLDGTLTFSGSGTGTYSADLNPSTLYLNPAILSLVSGTDVESASNSEVDMTVTFTGGTVDGYSGSISNSGLTVQTPEPTTFSMLGLGLLLLSVPFGFRKRLQLGA